MLGRSRRMSWPSRATAPSVAMSRMRMSNRRVDSSWTSRAPSRQCSAVRCAASSLSQRCPSTRGVPSRAGGRAKREQAVASVPGQGPRGGDMHHAVSPHAGSGQLGRVEPFSLQRFHRVAPQLLDADARHVRPFGFSRVALPDCRLCGSRVCNGRRVTAISRESRGCSGYRSSVTRTTT